MYQKISSRSAGITNKSYTAVLIQKNDKNLVTLQS